MNRSKRLNLGFTLIELLIVITVIGALAGIFVNTINARRQQEMAIDSQRRQRLKETAELIEGFRVSEGYYPDEGNYNNPLDDSGTDREVLLSFIGEWDPGLFYNVAGSDFSIHISSAISTNVYKYSSLWNSIRECSTTGSDYDMNDVSSCDEVDSGDFGPVPEPEPPPPDVD